MPNPRLKALFKSFPAAGIDALLVSSWPNVTYLSGFKNTESWILVSPKGLYFITDTRYVEQARREAVGFKVLLRDKRSVTEMVGELCSKMRVRHLGFESSIITHAFYLGLEKNVGKPKLKPTWGLVEALREIKDAGEIRLIQKSADIAVRGFHYVKQTAKPGMTERELQGRLEYYTKSIGSEKPAFDIIIATGARASMPHCPTNETRVRDNTVLLVDMGTVYGGYHSDLTRPIFLGRMSALQKKVYQIVWDAQRAGIAKAGPGVPVSEVDEACREYIRKAGYAEFFGHGTGHGVGLEIHEAPGVGPRSKTVLRPGMVITVEPGIYLPGKFGIRIEDMVLITDKGHRVMTAGLDRSS
ncbi:MAG TPA: Xaa-Pro peptidase family protein [Candidatus Eisenbacteria bacterium]|nr:Xaa-Pro peptidase family protein [Candidatus Eisenbacteria bacterium]